MTLVVLEPGILTTVQDLGRPGLGAVGLPPGGAADRWSMGVANRLLGNPPDAAVLEMTLAGPVVRAEQAVVLAVAGADLGAVVAGSGRRVPPGTTVSLAAGDVLAFPGPAADGIRAYLAVPGGIDVPVVLGSRATALPAGFGGTDGRPLRSGDRLKSLATGTGRRGAPGPGPEPGAATEPAMAPTGATSGAVRWPGPLHAAAADPRDPDPSVIRVMPGPHATGAGAAAFAALLAGSWRVALASDRAGLRLAGPALPGSHTGTLASHGVTWGSVQVPPDGWPIVLLADHQPTGGYPVVAVAILADHPRLGQLGPGDALHFVRCDVAGAVAALRAQQAALVEAERQLHDDARWEELWHSAGA
jgi:allophanate hydrolase subunit 2